MISGFSQRHAETIEAARRDDPFRSIDDFTRRTKLPRAVLSRLAEADAFGSLGRDRRHALWEALAQEKRAQPLPLFDSLEPHDEPPAALPALSEQQQVFADYQTTGLSLRKHPISFYRPHLDRLRITPADRLRKVTHGRHVRVAGLVLMRQRPSTAKGITFVTIEDETGTANLIIHRQTWDRYYRVARRSPAYIAHGRLESKYSVIHVVVSRLEDLSERLAELDVKSRDFR